MSKWGKTVLNKRRVKIGYQLMADYIGIMDKTGVTPVLGKNTVIPGMAALSKRLLHVAVNLKQKN